MQFCRYADARYGVVRDGFVYDVTDVVDAAVVRGVRPRRGDLVYANFAAVRAAVESVPLEAPVCALADAAFLSPVAQPPKLVCAPVNYQAHVAESIADAGITFNHAVARIDQAGLFLKAASSLVGPSEGVAVRFADRRTDHEVELALVIGRECGDVAEEHALDVVAGYTIGLDMTVRGTEDRSFRKSIDTYAVLGPWLVSADRIPDPNALDLSLAVNGATRQSSNTAKLIFNVQKLIAWASRWYTLYPGDVLYTGTPEGVGPVDAGDVMTARIAGIGEMNVAVRAAAPMAWSSNPVSPVRAGGA
jgi:2-keto-4-pentenoate hydratase/2-oxohepta-3-ene-1,7-dioic acid hydratase in catechol pathway